MSVSDGIRPDVWAAMRECRLWSTASDAAVEQVLQVSRVREVTRGETLAVEGDSADSFGIVVAGKVRVFYLGGDGKQLTFEVIESGGPYAAVAALAEGRYPAHIEAATDGTVVIIPGGALYEMLAREPVVAKTLVGDLARRVVNFTSVVQTLSLDVPSRLARYLFQRSLQSGRPSPRGLLVDLGMKKGELAMALGTVPETLSRAFGRLKDDGIVEVNGTQVTVLDVRALAAMGSGYDE